MPVVIKSAPHDANIVSKPFEFKDAVDAMPYVCKDECKELLQCGIDFDSGSNSTIQSNNGFIDAVTTAYNMHNHLEIRPEDVWFSILTQFSAYVNAHAEMLRGKFVSHDGKKELVLKYEDSTRYTFDFSIFASDMGKLLQENVVDPELREWIMPNFSTTTAQDTVMASIVMMASMQQYFQYLCVCMCGIPTVTLLGEKSDWEKLLQKLEKLKTFGEQTTLFYDLLKPIITRFMRSFDEPNSPDIVDFWQRTVSHESMGSGESFYSGWITAFCFWSAKGSVLYKPNDSLELDGIRYGSIGSDSIVPGWAKVPVKIIDNGEEISSVMVAGSTIIEYKSSTEMLSKGAKGADTLAPRLCWWIYEKK